MYDERVSLTPPELAKRYGIHPDKIRLWINWGELRASNLATKPGGRPQWRVKLVDWEAFLARRSNMKELPPHHRRRKMYGVTKLD